MSDLLNRLRVNYSLQHEAADRIEQLEAELAALKSPQEPVAIVRNGNVHWIVDNWPDNTNLYAAPPLREGWVSVPKYATQKQINAMAKLDLPNTPYCEIYAAAIAASEEGRK